MKTKTHYLERALLALLFAIVVVSLSGCVWVHDRHEGRRDRDYDHMRDRDRDHDHDREHNGRYDY